MKTHILLLLLALAAITSTAQNRKYIGNFSQLKHYYNPSLTGYDGSQLKTLYRNQWTGFEDAPKTIAASAELNLNDFKKSKGYQLNNEEINNSAVKHSIGLFLLRDSFGPYSESQVNLSYGSGITLSEKLMLRWGAALTYSTLALDGNKLTLENQNDPKYANVLGHNNRSGKMDLNLGITLASRNFYVGYAMQDVTQGKIYKSGDEFINDMYMRKHVGLAGVRAELSPSIAMVLNGLYQYDELSGSTTEGQLKAIYQNIFWAGAGYRNNLAFTATAGLSINRLQISYLYETPVSDAATVNKPTNEIGLAYRLKLQGGRSALKNSVSW